MAATLDIDALVLGKGKHSSRDDGLCMMEATAWLVGESHTDHPKCVSPVIAAFCRQWNDDLGDADRQKLRPYVRKVTRGNPSARRWKTPGRPVPPPVPPPGPPLGTPLGTPPPGPRRRPNSNRPSWFFNSPPWTCSTASSPSGGRDVEVEVERDPATGRIERLTFHPGQSRPCPGGCGAAVAGMLPCCPACWVRLPEAFRDRCYRAFRDYQSNRLTAPELLRAYDDAVSPGLVAGPAV